MSEILSPVGNKEAFYAAIANGCDAIYLGLNKHNARAYADNFSLDNLKEYVDFAHLRNVKVYVTLNTIAYDCELEEIYQMIDELALLNVDAIIVQDLAILNYAVSNYKSLEVHASTQMGIDDVYGAKLLKQLGVTRVVLARETPIEMVKQIKEQANIEVETFIHGALCVSYSGNCFMSGAIGERSGNRGRCAGCCRKKYSLIDIDKNQILKCGYLLSMKDLNLSPYIKNMDFVDSFKIEGRMKEDTYVAAVTDHYRKIVDNEAFDKETLEKVFNRTYTKGFIYGEDSVNITNIDRPNNVGYKIGKVIKIQKNKIWIKLFKELNKGDNIRIENGSFEDTNLIVSKMLDSSFNVVETSKSTIVIYTDKKVNNNSSVYKTKDIKLNKSVNLGLKQKEYKKLGLNISIEIKMNQKILIKVCYKNHTVYQKSDYSVEISQTNPISKNDIMSHLSKLNDTPYFIENINIDLDENVFVPVKVLNELRRSVVDKLNASRLNKKVKRNKENFQIIPQKYEESKPQIVIEVSSQEQYDFVKALGYNDIYFKNIVRRNNVKYIDEEDTILIGGLSSLYYYKNKDINLVTDYSLNVNNHVSAALLSMLGAKRITLSNELHKDQISNLISKYKESYKTHPNLEMIIYGRATLMHSKYCPLKRIGLCGECKNKKFALRDDYESFPLRFNDDCTINLLNAKTLNLIDDIDDIKGINYFRLVFTTESLEEIDKVLISVSKKLNGENISKCFDGKTQTRGNYKKQLL